MSNWREWELSDTWSSNDKCPECGEPLIITHLVTPGISSYYETSDLHNGICITCRKQYSVFTPAGTLTVNEQAVRQQDRVDALEERVAKLEDITQKLLASLLPQRQAPNMTPKPSPEVTEADEIRSKYRFLLG